MKVLSFEDLPAAVSELCSKVDYIQQLLSDQGKSPAGEDRWLSIEELCEYLPGKPAKATIYAYAHHRKIPHKKLGKRLAFLQSEIDEWLHTKGRKTLAEIQAEADQHPKRKRG